jgi:hypothetical protein
MKAELIQKKIDNENMDQARRELRTLVSTMYDLQKLRISVDNRLKRKKDGTMMKGYAQDDVSKYLLNEEIFSIQTFANELFEKETLLKKQIEVIVEGFDIYTRYLKTIKGCGPLMSAVIISEIDIRASERYKDESRRRCMAVSNIWSYAGLNSEKVKGFKFIKVGYALDINGVDVDKKGDPKLVKTKVLDRALAYKEGQKGRKPIWKPMEGAKYVSCSITSDEAKRIKEETGKVITGEWIRTNLLIDGDHPTTGFKIPYNKFLKTKLVGVLGSSIIKSQGPYCYYFYNHRDRLRQKSELLEESGETGITPAHIKNQSMRVMIKAFLRDLYVAWRTIEGLPVRKPYEEEYLGRIHNALTLEELEKKAAPYIAKVKAEKLAKKSEKENEENEEN